MFGKSQKSLGCVVAMIAAAVVVIFVIVFAASFIGTYNNLVALEENVNLAQSNVQAQMQRRLELIPDLVETTKAAAEHEEKIYEDIANARAALTQSLESGDAAAIDQADKQLSTAINNFLVVVENYPTITASAQYTSLMDQLEGSVNRITVAREIYNAAVTTYNTKIRLFPGNILAGMFGFEKMEEFEADEAAKQTNMVDFG